MQGTSVPMGVRAPLSQVKQSRPDCSLSPRGWGEKVLECNTCYLQRRTGRVGGASGLGGDTRMSK